NSPDSTGQLRFTPVANQFGSAVITVTVEDGGDDNDLNTSSDNLTFSRTFTVTVSSVNDAPLIDPIIEGESDGSDFLIDETFGTSGLFSQTLPSTVQWSEVIALDDGSLILGGRYGGLYSSGERFIVGKLTPEGQFDSSFGTQGGYSFAQFSARGNTRDMIVDSQGRILLSGYVRIGEYGAGVARFLPNGMLDASFGNNGLLTWSDGQTFGIKINERPDGGYVVGGRNTSTPVRNAPFHWISEAGVIEETTRYTGIGDLVMEMTFTPEGDLLAVVRDNNADFYTVRINSNRELV
ncbi:MAG: hypothetical protein GY904_06085, partial [Planctomycetaceae bacterium]|nr:hypothetical protein [Planctomycetaceae bacterium]